mmetsp:Transcript_30998/g.68076  ORF Transcript_30998/g.68076 Transcript_30998/m.68076 type:complete len:280 (+) Transcript_30998:326-1165(+)
MLHEEVRHGVVPAPRPQGIVVPLHQLEPLAPPVGLVDPLGVVRQHKLVVPRCRKKGRDEGGGGILDGLQLHDVELVAVLDRGAHPLEEHPHQPRGRLHVQEGIRELTRQGPQASERTVADDGLHPVLVSRRVHQRGGGSHGSTPQPDARHLARGIQVVDHPLNVVLLVVAQGHMLPLGDPRPREIQGEHRDSPRQQGRQHRDCLQPRGGIPVEIDHAGPGCRGGLRGVVVATVDLVASGVAQRDVRPGKSLPSHSEISGAKVSLHIGCPGWACDEPAEL